MNPIHVIVRATLLSAAIGVALADCGSSNGSTTSGDGGSGGHDGSLASSSGSDAQGSGSGGDASLTASVFTGNGGSCLKLGSSCASGSDCCSADCANGICAYPSCMSDNQACTTNGNCCSQNCANGLCAPLNQTCKTLGNQCTASSDCCSGLCKNGSCQASSFCGQGGDACSASADCCTGTCTVPSGQTLGTCGAAPPGGPANCGLTDGQLCGGTAADGGVVQNDAGLPACGGPCCSRACAPWGPTGVLVCQPASGCHVVGDLCTKDSDCCGSAGLPGGSGKPVTCVISSGTVGVCRLPMGCKPDGDVCKLKTSSCNSSCDCCSGNCETQDTCKQDNVGVPRCAAVQCVNAGGSCASSANCCGGNPCVPNPTAGAMPPYVCSATQCIAACGQCTNNADCCPGSSCVVAPGSTHGICGPCGGSGGDAGTPPPPDGGTPPADAGMPPPPPPDSGGGGSCAQYGQICVANADCCNGVPCTQGRCEYPIF